MSGPRLTPSFGRPKPLFCPWKSAAACCPVACKPAGMGNKPPVAHVLIYMTRYNLPDMKRFLLTLLPAAAWAQEKPNVIWLMADDLGYGDISCYGATRMQTPNIDRVASQGVRFTDMHACASTSTPSRYGILTGEYPFCHPGTDVAAGNAGTIIWPQQYTMADMMRSAGYRTGAFGKWLETGAMFPKGGGIAPVCVQQMCFCGLLGSSCLASKHSDGDRVGEWISLGRRMQRMGWRGCAENAVRCMCPRSALR